MVRLSGIYRPHFNRKGRQGFAKAAENPLGHGEENPFAFLAFPSRPSRFAFTHRILKQQIESRSEFAMADSKSAVVNQSGFPVRA